MKKLPILLTSTLMIVASTASVVSCSPQSMIRDKNPDFNFQKGPSKVDGHNDSNDYLTSFNVGPYASYSAYNIINNDLTKPVFNGDKENFLKTRDDNFKLSGWLNDKISFQNVLYFNKAKGITDLNQQINELNRYSNIKYDLVDATDSIKDEDKLTGDVKFEKYILTKLDQGDHSRIADSIKNERQYIPDAIAYHTLSSPVENVIKDNGNFDKDPARVPFDIWNAWATISTPSSKTAKGTHKMKLTISFNYDGKPATEEQQLVKTFDVDIKNRVYENKEKDFGLHTNTYPAASVKWGYDGNSAVNKHNINMVKKTNDTNQNWYLKIGEDFAAKWSNGTPKFPDGQKLIDSVTHVKLEYITSGSKLDWTYDDSKKLVSAKNVSSNVNDPFTALFRLYDANDKALGQYSLFYNELGQVTYPSARNNIPKSSSQADIDAAKNKTDLFNDGGKTNGGNYWDVDHDGKYTKEDYDANGDNQPDEIGPAPNHGDYWQLSPEWWDLVNQQISPLQDTNSRFITISGVQKQAIQYTGKLVDKTLENYVPGENDKAVDGYENALIKSDNKNNFNKFISSTDSHKWTWSFDFSNLDTYMRLAAGNDISQVMINPVDVTGFSFWYLKGEDAKIGPERKMLGWTNGIINSQVTRNLTPTGKAYVENVVKPMSLELEKHLEEIRKDKAYQTSDGRPVQLYYTFDEVNEHTMDYVMNAIKGNNKNKVIKSSGYLGWGSRLEKTGLWSGLQKDFKDKWIDRVVVQVRMLRNIWLKNGEDENAGLDRLHNLIHHSGKDVILYSTWDAYPGAYMQSDLSDTYWQLFAAYRAGTGGWLRWGYDYIIDDYFSHGRMDFDKKDLWRIKYSAGDAFLSYGSSKDGVNHPSKRLLGYANAVRYVNKMSILSNINDKYKINIAKIKKSIGYANAYKRNNNEYKWNEATQVGSSSIKLAKGMDYDVPTSKQVEMLAKYVDSL